MTNTTAPAPAAAPFPQPGAEPVAHVVPPQGGAPPYRHTFTPLPPRRRRVVHLASVRELVALAGFAILYHAAFGLTGYGGYGAAVFFATAGALVFVARRKVRAQPMALAMGTAVLVLAARLAYAPSVLAGVMATGALAGFALSMWRRNLHATDAFVATAAATGYGFAQMDGFARRIAAGLRAERAMPVVIAGVVASAVGLVFAGVFAFANPVVARIAEHAWGAVAALFTPALVGRLFATFVTMMAGVALMRPLLPRKRVEYIDSAVQPATDTFRMVAVTTLVVVNVLFVAYDILDAVVLVGGRPPSGVTTQAYAHQGVAWLTVALSLATTTLSFIFREALAVDPRANFARRLAFAWIAESIVLAGFALERVRMHIEYSGLSDLRFVAVLGILTATSGLVLVAHKIRAQRTFMWLVRRQADVFAVALALYVVLPTNALSARLNVARIQRGDLGPLVHVEEQVVSNESLPLMLSLLDHPDARVRNGVAAIAKTKLAALNGAPLERWSAGSVTETRARMALTNAKERIEALAVNTTSLKDFRELRNASAWEAANARRY